MTPASRQGRGRTRIVSFLSSVHSSPLLSRSPLEWGQSRDLAIAPPIRFLEGSRNKGGQDEAILPKAVYISTDNFKKVVYVFAQSRIELHRAVAIGAVDAKVRNLIARRLIAESSYAEIKKGSRDARRPIRPGVLSGIVPRLTQDIQKRLPCAPTVCLASFSPWRNIQSLRSSGTLNSPPL